MPATVIAERIGWEHSLTTLKDRVRQIRLECQGIDPADRITYEPGQLTNAFSGSRSQPGRNKSCLCW